MPDEYRLTGRIEKLLDFGESDDFVELPFDFAAAHAEDGAVEKNIFPAGQFGMKTGADFEQAADAAADFDPAGARFGDAAENFEQGRFPGAVAADDADLFALCDRERNIAQGPKFLLAAEDYPCRSGCGPCR